MILSLFLAAAAPQTAIEAERAFASEAQTNGQWTAFRKYAAPDGILFSPGPVQAHDLLKELDNPPVAVMWWPSESWVSCDGALAVTTGPWLRRGGQLKGYFTTVWARRADGSWRWLLDHGDDLDKPRSAGERPEVRTASCSAPGQRADEPALTEFDSKGGGKSPDGTLLWSWGVRKDQSRTVSVKLWNGSAYEMVLHDSVAPPGS